MWEAGLPLSLNTPSSPLSPPVYPHSLLLGSTLSLLGRFHWRAESVKNQQRSHPPPPPSTTPFTRPTAGCSSCPCTRVFSGGMKAEKRSAWIKCVCVWVGAGWVEWVSEQKEPSQEGCWGPGSFYRLPWKNVITDHYPIEADWWAGVKVI